MSICFFVNGRRCKTDDNELDWHSIMAWSDDIQPNRQLLLERDDGPDEIIRRGDMVMLEGGERFITLPPAAMGG